MHDSLVSALLAEFDIEVVARNQAPLPGQTRAVGTVARLMAKHGPEHMRLVLCVLAEGKGNNALIDEYSLTAVSDILMACSDLVEQDAGAVLEMFDKVPMGPFMALAYELRGFVKQSAALAGMLYLALRRMQEESLTGRAVCGEHVSRINASEAEKGRAPFRRGAHRTREEKIEIGRMLIAKKAALAGGQFGPWLRQSSLSERLARDCMALARDADNAADSRRAALMKLGSASEIATTIR